jgi:Fe2+ transport system protein B
VPVKLALNMTDALKKDGAKINISNLSQLLGNIPVIQTAANHGRGISELLTKAVHAAREN